MSDTPGKRHAKSAEAVETGQRIKSARQAKGLTQGELGDLLNPPTPWRTVSHWEQGDYMPKSPRREQLAVILGLNLGDIDSMSKREMLQELLFLRTRIDQLIVRL